MNAPRSARTQRQLELRAEVEERVQQRRQQPTPSWLMIQRNRRALALMPAATLALGVLAAALAEDLRGVAIMMFVALAALIGTLMLRRATQMLDAAPSGLLDEREIEQRNRAHQLSHRFTLAVLGVLWLLAMLDSFLSRTADTELFGSEGWMILIVSAVFAVSMLPAAALAWNWQSVTDDSDS